MKNARGFRLHDVTLYLVAIFVAGCALTPVHASERAENAAVQCGNGVLEPGETCTTCPADCAVRRCDAGKAQSVTVHFRAPADHDISGVTVLLGYRSDRLSLPGRGADASVRERLTDTPDHAIVAVNDLDYGMRVVVGRSQPIGSGRLFMVRFDACGSAAAPAATDVACTVEACATVFGPAQDCSCAATLD